MEGEQQLHKKHVPRHGKTVQQRKKKQKQRKDGSSNSVSGAAHNPKAFTFSGGVVSVQRRVQRTLDRLSLKAKEEKIDKTPDVPPPYIVVVHGPPNVGKTTLIRSLVRHYTRHALQVVRGPITVVASQQRRLTFVECSGTNLHQMLDAAKVADLVLLLIDASFGFEMETFEFINILQTHGFPRVIGVLTRLDRVGAQRAKTRLSLPPGGSSSNSSSSNSSSSNSSSSNSSSNSSSSNSSSSNSSSNSSSRNSSSSNSSSLNRVDSVVGKESSRTGVAGTGEEEEGGAARGSAAGKMGSAQQVRRRKKELKKRFWTEIYEGAKLFYLTGLQFEGKYYKKREILNLSRYIAVQRFSTLTWRSAHPYLLSLRCEPLAPLLPAASSSSRTESISAAAQPLQQQQRETEDTAAQTAACAFYGYVRGAVLRQGQWLHIPGAGDFQIKSISCCDDPCPSPAAAKRQQHQLSSMAKSAAAAAEDGKEEEETKAELPTRRSRRMRSLKDQQRTIYAPAADVGSVRVDADAMYIHLPDSKVSFTRPELLLREGEEKQQQVSEQPVKKELQQDEAVSSRESSSSGEKRRSSKKTLTSGSTCSSESGEEETEDSAEEGETADGDVADLGAGNRDLIVRGAAAKEKKGKEEDIGDAVKMVRELQEAQQILHVRQQEQQLRLLPTSACTLAAAATPATASPGALSSIRQLSAASDTEEEEDMWGDEEEEERMILEQQQARSRGDASVKGRRRAAPPPASREAAAAADSDAEESEDATAESDSEEEEEEYTGEDEEDETAVEAIHAAARQRFQRPPTLQDLLYSADCRMNWQQQQQQSSNSSRRRAAAESPQGNSSKGVVAKLLGDKTLPLFEEEEEEEELSFSTSSGSSRTLQRNGLYGALPAVLPLLSQRHVVSSSTETRRLSRGGEVVEAATFGTAAAAAAGVQEEEEDTAIVSDDVLYAAVESEHAREENERDYWSTEKMEELKACYFITGGWSSAEEEEEEKKSSSSSSKEEILAMQGSDEREEEEEKQKQQKAETQRQLLEARELQQQEQQQQGAGEGWNSSAASQLHSVACACIGSFVRVYIEHIPLRWLQHLSAERLVLLGGLSAGERGQSFLKFRAKRHRWYPRVLKSDDVLLFSAGWRRFQSLPLFALEDRSEARLRYLKYTPEHFHCLCCTWGPVLPAATPFVAMRFTHATAHYRICLSGLLLESSPSLLLKKKLKLLGEPSKIYKNTAFIAQMFNSDLEVNMCLGAKIQTVSGIRGQIKKAHGSHGVFRAAFEDKILMSDLVICKSWLSLQPRQFYNAVLDIPEWTRLRTHVEIRQALQLPAALRSAAAAADPRRQQKQLLAACEEEEEGESTHQAGRGGGGGGSGGVGALQNQRRTTIFSPIKIPKQLMLKLPFHTRTKLQLRSSRLKKLKGKDKEEEEEMRKPLVNAYDRRVAALLQRLQTIRNARLEKKKEKQQQKLEKKAAVAAKQAAEKSRKQLEIRRKRYVKQGKMETAMRKKMRFASSS